MRIVNLAQSNLCNIGTSLNRGLRANGHDARSVVLQPAPYGMDVDLMWSRDEGACRQALEEAEVLHLSSLTPGFTVWLQRLPFSLPRLVRRRRLVVHYHGGDLRRQGHRSVKALIARHGVPAVVTVPDLLPYLPGSEWLPLPVDPADPRCAPANPPASPIRICHAPTTRSVKKTDAFLAAMERLRRKHDVETVLIENRPYEEALAIKRTCHINFDNIGFGSYALASIESLLMEHPSLVYFNDACAGAVREHSEIVGIESPFVLVGDARQPTHEHLRAIVEGRAEAAHTEEDIASIVRALESLVADDGMRRDLGRRGRRWATAVHDERRVARRAAEIYERAPRLDGFGLAERLLQVFWWGVATAKNMVQRGRGSWLGRGA